MADYEARRHQESSQVLAPYGRQIARIYIIRQCLPDSCKALRRLQELSVLTSRTPPATLLAVVYGFGERVPLLIVADTQ
jgi:hypothetical protein